MKATKHNPRAPKPRGRTLVERGMPTKWWHGTKTQFETIKPQSSGCVWLADRAGATEYATPSYSKPGERWLLELDLAPDTSIVELADASDPIVQAYIAALNEISPHWLETPEEWSNKSINYNYLERNRWSRGFFRKYGVDALIVRDVAGWGGYDSMPSLCLLNTKKIQQTQRHALNNPKTARRTDPALWERIVDEVTAGDRGGLPGQWSARKAQLAVALYRQQGGGYIGPKSADNALAKWTREKWRTRSGRPSLVTGERYLPSKALAALSPQEYAATTRAKRAGMARGQQFVPQPERIAMKTAPYRTARRNPNYPNVSVYRGVLTSPEGRIRVKQIGKGQFSVAYLSEEPRPRVFLFTSGDVQDKEILMFAHDRLPNNPHLPAVEQYGETRDGKTVWTMPLYKAPLKKADNETAWKQYLALKRCREALYKPRGVKSGYQVNYDVYECAVAAGVSPKLANALEHLISTAADYDEEYVFEFSPRNLATDAEGHLVLLDVLYHRRMLFRKLGAAAARGF